MAIIDPVQSAISAFKDVDGVFRQDRLDKERLDQQQFQNQMLTNQDQRAAESHQIQVQADSRARKLETVNALRYKLTTDPSTVTDGDLQLLSQDPKLNKYITQPDLIVRDLKATADLHVDVPKLIGVPELISKAPDQTVKEALVKSAKESKKNIMSNLSVLGEDRLAANPENKKGEVSDLLMHENGLVIEGRFTKQDGKEVVAPLTAGKSSDPNDPINFYNVKDIMTNITSNAKMLAGLKTALEARGVELGDKKALDEAETRNRGKAAATVLEAELPGMSPSQQLQAKTAIGFLKSGEAKNIEEAIKLSQLVKPGKQGMILKEGDIYIDPVTKETLAQNPKSVSKSDYFKTEEGVKDKPGWVQDVYTDPDGKVAKRGEPRLQFNPKQDHTGKSEKEMERDSRADIDKSVANFQKRREDFNKARTKFLTLNPPDSQAYKDGIADMNAEYENLQSESNAITTKFETHKREFGRSYTPTAAPAANRSGGMSPTPPPAKAAAPAQKQVQDNKATSDGKNVTYQGKNYPLNADGSVTISGKKYRVQ
jgi:glucan-binding YG repeat protein